MRSFLLSCCITAISLSAVNAQSKPGTGDSKPAVATPATIASITQNLKKYEGYFNFYYDEKNGKILLEVDKLDTEFLYFSSLVDGVGNGGPERGQASADIAKFVKVGPKIFLVEPVMDYRAVNGNADEKRSVQTAFARSVIFGFAPLAMEGDKALIDLTPFLIRDGQHIGDALGSGRGNPGSAASGRGGGGGGGYRLDDSRSAIFIENTKNFPKNTEFEAMLTFTGGNARGVAPDAGSVTVNFHQALVQLPDNNFKPRKFDPRSGFFDFEYLDFAAP